MKNNKRQYGAFPQVIRKFGDNVIKMDEMCFYQYLPIKLDDNYTCCIEDRLNPIVPLIETAINDFIDKYGFNEYNKSYIYLTVKNLFVLKDRPFNRPGYHSDGFLTNDINYIYSDKYPTIFNTSNFNLTLDDSLSMKEMEEQASDDNCVTYGNNSLIRLDQYVIHKVGNVTDNGSVRLFVKISFSRDKYDLIGNSHNHLLNYKWEMKQRKSERNIPQSQLKSNA